MLTAFVFLLIVALWSAAGAYVILFMIMPALGKGKQDHGHGHGHAPKKPAPRTDHYARATRDYSTHEGFKSFAQQAELTVDDIVKGLSRQKD